MGLLGFVLFLVWVASFHAPAMVAGNKMKLECEKRCHASFSAQQRSNLCHQEEYSLGPAACSVMAKEVLHLRYEDTLKLCREAPSAAPVECMLQLDSKDRAEIGYQLCAQAISTVPSDCFQNIVKIGKTSKKVIAEFCQSNLDHAPDLCVQAAYEHLGMKVEEAIRHCSDAVGSGDASASNPRNTVIANCIALLKDYNRNAYNVQGKDIVRFCSAINPNQYVDLVDEDYFPVFSTAATDCFLQMVQDRAESSVRLSYQNMLDLCHNALVALGPTNCTQQVQQLSAQREPHLRLSPESIVALCQGATSSAPAVCFAESKGLGNMDDRAALCNSATNTGPAMCYRRSTAVFKNNREEHHALCISAESEGPAECAVAAPHYLVAEEKVHLCASAPVTGYLNPIKCLQAVHTYSKNFRNAPKRALGYFQENLQLDTEWTSRALLVSMCSFSDSQDPLAAAECYKSVPTSLQHDDAVRLCTNISSSQAIQHIQLCQRILPKTWSSEAISYLCEGLDSRGQTEAIVKCAVDLSKLSAQQSSQTRMLDALGIAKLCRTERAESQQYVMKCVQRLSQLPSSAATLLLHHSSQQPSPAAGASISGSAKQSTNKQQDNSLPTFDSQRTVMTLCEHATSTKTADCVHEMAKLLTSQVSFAPNMTEKICLRLDSASILVCMSHIKHKRLLDGNDVLKCAEEKRTLSSIRVKRIYSWEDDSLEIMAGKRFSLLFDVFDQWQQKYEDEDDADVDYGATSSYQKAKEKTVLKISINENNAQGAILWGYRTNTTFGGSLYFHSLIISQPGPIEVRVTIPASVNADSDIHQHHHHHHHQHHHHGRKKDRMIAIFKLTVKEDPVIKETAPCMYVLRDSFCPHDAMGSDHDAMFPMTRTYVSQQRHYLHNLYCAGEKLGHWGIRSYIAADGSLHADYRSGIDSIWTGIGLPRYEMSAEQKLGLIIPSDIAQQYYGREGVRVPSGVQKTVIRLIKRTYYRASLQWHPDRWSGAGLEAYKPIVQGIFQQITDAYDACQSNWLRTCSGGATAAASATSSSEGADGGPIETPVYE